MLKLYNTYKHQEEVFKPLEGNDVRLYTCGPTVYGNAHLGNFRYFIFEDVLYRTLKFLSFDVHHVMNITDVGHLTSDEDFGEDKMEKGAARERKTVWQVAEEYTQQFLSDAKKLNIHTADILAPATKHITEIQEMVKLLLDKGFAYETGKAIYFDIAKFPEYETLTGQKLSEKIQAARVEVVEDPAKRHSADFALWFKTVDRFANHTMRWDSPWGEGFPGWHIECSAISHKYLGQPFDIHTGGVDHIPVHHPNEIAQSQSAYDKPLSKFWLHSEHMTIEGQKISKSLGNTLLVEDLAPKGYSAMDFRYLVLTSNYKNRLNFTWEGLSSAAKAYANLQAEIENYEPATESNPAYVNQFKEALEADLDTPKALTVLWGLIHDKTLTTGTKRATVQEMDKVLGLDLGEVVAEAIPAEIMMLIRQRDQVREAKDWVKSDELRKDLEKMGYLVEDTSGGTKIRRK